MKRLKRYFVTGLVVLLPLLLSVFILVKVFNFADNVLGRFLNSYFRETLGFYIPGLGLILSLLIVLAAGFSASHFLGKKLYPFFENIILKIPLLNKIYPTLRQIVLFILRQEEFGFKKAVLVQYPSKGIWSLGFVTNQGFTEIDNKTNDKLVCVFIPNSPGPLTGYAVFFPQREVVFLDLSVQDALKIIISGGIFKP